MQGRTIHQRTSYTSSWSTHACKSNIWKLINKYYFVLQLLIEQERWHGSEIPKKINSLMEILMSKDISLRSKK